MFAIISNAYTMTPKDIKKKKKLDAVPRSCKIAFMHHGIQSLTSATVYVRYNQ